MCVKQSTLPLSRNYTEARDRLRARLQKRVNFSLIYMLFYAVSFTRGVEYITVYNSNAKERSNHMKSISCKASLKKRLTEVLAVRSPNKFLQPVSIACYAKRCITYRKSVRLSVCLSFRLSVAGTVSKRLQLRSWMKVGPYSQRQKCRPMNLVSENVRFMRIFAGVPLGAGVKRHWGLSTTAIFG